MSNQVAQIILQQLGGNKFVVMTGAKNLTSHGDENALSFRLSGTMTRNKANYVKITLDANDTYTVYFGNIRKLELKQVSKFEDIYCDGLVELFENETGLRTKLF